MDETTAVLALLGVAVAFTVSAAVGFGGSLILVPTLALLTGTKQGVALAALLLAGNNVVKVYLYRKTIPLRACLLVVVCVAVGAALGASAMVALPEAAVTTVVIVGFVIAFLAERFKGFAITTTNGARGRKVAAPLFALTSGATSGLSGTSGPLKGVAVRTLGMDRVNTVGALSMASLVGDLTKSAVFTEAGLLTATEFWMMAAAVPVMLAASLLGRRLNSVIGERGFTGLFWGIMICYTGRLLIAL